MKASELGLNSIIYFIKKATGEIGQFVPTSLSMINKIVEIDGSHSIKVKEDFHFHEETTFVYFFDEKSWYKAMLPLQETKVNSLETQYTQAKNWLAQIKKEINKIENGI